MNASAPKLFQKNRDLHIQKKRSRSGNYADGNVFYEKRKNGLELVFKNNVKHRLRLVARRATAVNAKANGKRHHVFRQHFIKNRLKSLRQKEAKTTVIKIGFFERLPVDKIEKRRPPVVRFENIAFDKNFVAANKIVVRRILCKKFNRAALVLRKRGQLRDLCFFHNHMPIKLNRSRRISSENCTFKSERKRNRPLRSRRVSSEGK